MEVVASINAVHACHVLEHASSIALVHVQVLQVREHVIRVGPCVHPIVQVYVLNGVLITAQHQLLQVQLTAEHHVQADVTDALARVELIAVKVIVSTHVLIHAVLIAVVQHVVSTVVRLLVAQDVIRPALNAREVVQRLVVLMDVRLRVMRVVRIIALGLQQQKDI